MTCVWDVECKKKDGDKCNCNGQTPPKAPCHKAYAEYMKKQATLTD
ncbi:MAG: hypothetical protein JRC86_05465 [Deltaproteobacteria bacterium]|nr:hypothetical protein [Deltaproteobacteria bacterium]